MKNQNDQRVVKTRESLVNAYLELLIENVSSKVLDICNRADISPITFYHHFGDKQELIKYVIDQQLQHILPIPEKLKPSGYKQFFNYLIKSLTSFFIKNKEGVFNSLKQIDDKGYKYSYLDVLNKTILYKSENESNNYEYIHPTIKSIMITWFIGGLLCVIYISIKEGKPLYIEYIWESIKLFASIITNKN